MRVACFALVVLVAGCLAPGSSVPAPSDAARGGLVGVAGEVVPVVIRMPGYEASGLLATPATGSSGVLVVVAHHLGGTARDFEPLLARLAAEKGAWGIAMEFEGARDAWKIRSGADESIAAALAMQRAHPSIERTILYGFSMGGAVGGVAIAEAPAGTFDYWIEGAGVMDLAAEWAEQPLFQRGIEEETGGSPATAADAYAERSPISRVEEIAAAGLSRVFIVHGAADPVVPFEQAERMFRALGDAGVPVSLYVAPPPALHDAGFSLVWPLIEHRVDELPDPAEPRVRGTVDPSTNEFDPSDVG